MSPMGLINFAEMPGTFYEMDEEEAYFYAERAAGGVAVILNGGAAVDKLGHSDPGLLCLYDERIIPSLKRTVDMVHATAPDCRFGLQLLHGGLQALFPVEAPSGGYALAMGLPGTPAAKELTKERILQIEEQFGVAAARAKEVGCDLVEIHGAHGYLIGEFYSPIFNHRTDEYGGSFENRVRFYVEVLQSIKTHVGADFPVGCRINADDYIEGGWTLEDACKLAPILEREGADYIHVSFGIYGSTARSGLPGTGLSIAPMYDKPGEYIVLAEEVKKHVSIPVVGGCRMKDPILADEVIRDGKADLVYMGRPLLADPELPNKAREGRIGEIKPCQGCCWCIEAAFKKRANLTCVMNPRVSREMTLKDVEGECAANPKKVLVIGGGAAGMEAARLTAFRGHKVILCESKGWLGGQLKLASMMPGREEFADQIAYYERELQRLAVPIRLNTTVDEALIDEIKPDVVIVATGSLPEVPYIPGLLDSGVEIITIDDLIEKKLPTGDNVLVIGGDADGLQCAHYLALHGRKVWVAHPGEHYAERIGSHNRYPLRVALKKLGVSLYKEVSLPESSITSGGVKIVHKKGTETLPKIDTVVLAGERTKNAYVAEITEKKGIETHIVGDADMLYEDPLAGSVLMATQSANEVARRIK
jgi:2,4-dienoyl-CoA reductase-like NADH-dependent reductase (Old Yellow Enzyme family)/thioredoxin reductase